MSERRFREKFIWWHRLKGHSVIKGFGLLSPTSAWKCEECDIVWTRSLI